jgi:hypothetical protein
MQKSERSVQNEDDDQHFRAFVLHSAFMVLRSPRETNFAQPWNDRNDVSERLRKTQLKLRTFNRSVPSSTFQEATA